MHPDPLDEPMLNEDEQRFMRWLEEGDVHGHHLHENAVVPPEWLHLRAESEQLGSLLRANLPHKMEPPNMSDFNEQVLRQLD